MGVKARKACSVVLSIVMALSMVSASALTAFADEANAASAVQLEGYDVTYGIRNVGGETLALMEVIPTDDQPGRLDLVRANGEVVDSVEYTNENDSSSWRTTSKGLAELSVIAFNRNCNYLFKKGDDGTVNPTSYNGAQLGKGSYTYATYDRLYEGSYFVGIDENSKVIDVFDADGKQMLHVTDAKAVVDAYSSKAYVEDVLCISLTSGERQYYQLKNGAWTLAVTVDADIDPVGCYVRAKADGSEALTMVVRDTKTGKMLLSGSDGLQKEIDCMMPDGATVRHMLFTKGETGFQIAYIYYSSSGGSVITTNGFYDFDGTLTGSRQGISSNYVSIGEDKFVRAYKASDDAWYIEFVDGSGSVLSSSPIPVAGSLGYYLGVGLVGNYVVVSGEAGIGGRQTYVYDTDGNLKLDNLYSFYQAPFGGYVNRSDLEPSYTGIVYDENLNVVYQHDSSQSYVDEAVVLANGQIVSPSTVYDNEKDVVFCPAMSAESPSVEIAGYRIGTSRFSDGVGRTYAFNQLARDNGNFIYACDANGKYGAIDAQGNVRLHFEYDAYFDTGETDFIMVEKDGAWSFLDLSGVIEKDPVDISTLFISAAEFVYDGKSAVSPSLTVKDDDKVLSEGVDYKVSSVNYDLSAGTGTATVEGIGAYAGSAAVSFAVTVPDALRFPDVAQPEWYFESCAFAKANGLISGYENGDFGPVDTLTRAQAAAILQRYFAPAEADAYDASSAANQTGMSDVAGSSWYTGAANWAVREGVINGKLQEDGSRLFDPDGVITREQLCAIVGNAAAKWCGAAVEGADRTKLGSLLGAEFVSDWAVDSVAWGVNAGVINGVATDAGRDVAAGANVERSVMAAVMMNAIQNGVIGR